MCDNQEAAGCVLAQWGSAPPEQHHRKTRKIMGRHLEDIIALKDTGIVPPAWQDTLDRLRTTPLSEQPAEGWHGTSRVHRLRAHPAKHGWVLACNRLPLNIEKCEEWITRSSMGLSSKMLPFPICYSLKSNHSPNPTLLGETLKYG